MLWKLAPHNDWKPWFDCMFSCVVRAASEQAARELAHANRGYESTEGDGWLDPSITSCERIWPDGDAEVICRDIHWA
jgi:hypothetical protein